MDLTHGLAHTCGTQKPAGKTSNIPSETKLAVYSVGTHEIEVLFDVGTQEFEHLFWGQAGRRERVGGAYNDIVDNIPTGLEYIWVSVRKIIDHDLREEFFDGGVDERAGADCECSFVPDEALPVFDASMVATIHVDPFVTSSFEDSYVC